MVFAQGHTIAFFLIPPQRKLEVAVPAGIEAEETGAGESALFSWRTFTPASQAEEALVSRENFRELGSHCPSHVWFPEKQLLHHLGDA